MSKSPEVLPETPDALSPLSVRISDLSDQDKPREKALRHGVESLTDAELIAIILGSGMPGKSVIALSQEILRDNDNRLSRLATMSVHELSTKYQGVGPAKSISLMAAIELGSRCVNSLSTEELPRITGSQSVHALMKQRLERLSYEEFWVVYLNQANRVISTECVSKGGVSSTIADVRLILKRALDRLATGIILVHNHPSGNLSPSAADDSLTSRIRRGAEAIDLRVLDHVIISPAGFYSYNDNSRL